MTNYVSKDGGLHVGTKKKQICLLCVLIRVWAKLSQRMRLASDSFLFSSLKKSQLRIHQRYTYVIIMCNNNLLLNFSLAGLSFCVFVAVCLFRSFNVRPP